MIQRGIAGKAHPTMEWLHDDGKWVQKTSTAIKKFQIAFVVGEVFDEELADGRKSKVQSMFFILFSRKSWKFITIIVIYFNN